jgi:drug/metabolite transporter (DMT)-like permease
LGNALWQRASATISAANAFASQKNSFMKQLLIGLILVMVGGIGQSLFLEAMVRIDSGCGPTITFFSFLFIALQGLKDFMYVKPSVNAEGKEEVPTGIISKIASLRMRPRKIHIIYHAGERFSLTLFSTSSLLILFSFPFFFFFFFSGAGCVLMSWLSAVLSSQAYLYNISVPFHMVFKSSILLVNMCIGMIVMRKRYNLSQVASVLLLTIGVLLTTLASLPKTNAVILPHFYLPPLLLLGFLFF